jgi:UDPglucose 6-dehydrogenase
MQVAVIGSGYLGTTHAACMAQIGHSVLGIDIAAEKVAKLQSGEVPFFEPDLEGLLKENLASGRLRFSTSYEEAAEFADVHFLAVGTPQSSTGRGVDLSCVDAAIDALSPHLVRPAVIAGKSTVPVGTAHRLAQRVRSMAPAGEAVELAWNPEFLREGFAVQDTLHPDRIVLGVENGPQGRAMETLRELYSPILDDAVPFMVTDMETAELAKTAANAFLATKVGFINAIAELCEAGGADVTVLADAIGCDKRIGRGFLNAGLGFGGGCLPKDIRALVTRAEELGVGGAFAFLREIDNANMRLRSRIVDITREICGSLIGTRVAILGAAFKPNTDDIRDSPALSVAGQFQLQGANVTVYDPKAIDNARKALPTLDYAISSLDACRGADVVLVLTEWEEFTNLQPRELAAVTRARNIIDARNCLDPHKWRAAGWLYRGLGRALHQRLEVTL